MRNHFDLSRILIRVGASIEVNQEIIEEFSFFSLVKIQIHF